MGFNAEIAKDAEEASNLTITVRQWFNLSFLIFLGVLCGFACAAHVLEKHHAKTLRSQRKAFRRYEDDLALHQSHLLQIGELNREPSLLFLLGVLASLRAPLIRIRKTSRKDAKIAKRS